MKMTEKEDGTIEFQANKRSKWLWRWGLKWLCAIPLFLFVVISLATNQYYSFANFYNSHDGLKMLGIGVLIYMFGYTVSRFKMAQAHRTFYRLTKYGIEIRKGITHEEALTVPWQAVRMVKIFRRDIDLMMSQGQVHVECAGDEYPEIEFKGLDNWEEVKDILLERMALAGK